MKTLKIIGLFFALLGVSSCTLSNFELDFISGEGPVVEKELSLSDFSKIKNSTSVDVIVKQGDVQKVVAVGQENIINRLNLAVYNNRWDINLESGSYNNFNLTIYITLPKIDEVKISGSGNVNLENFSQTNDLTLIGTGSGDINLNKTGSIQNMYVTIQGSGNINFLGEEPSYSNFLEINNSASGNYNGFLLRANQCTTNVSGSGNCKVNVSNQLNVRIIGSGDVYFKGNPRLNVNNSGSGKLISQ